MVNSFLNLVLDQGGIKEQKRSEDLGNVDEFTEERNSPTRDTSTVLGERREDEGWPRTDKGNNSGSVNGVSEECNYPICEPITNR